MTDSTDEGATFIRLHITPLDPALLPVVLSSSMLPKARNISYHELATFPEKRYGFLELPAEDAAKLKKKLSGAVLKGQKIRVEEAKLERQPEPIHERAMLGDDVPVKKDRKERKEKKEDKVKKRKREAEEIPGIELEEGRKVKRGWTVADDPKSYKDKEKRKKEKKDKKDKKQKRETKSKYTEHTECLVKAVIPTKVVETAEVDEEGKKKRRKPRTKEVVVHEFAKTTKFPTFLKSTVSSSSAKGKGEIEFVDGKGWVDSEGNVVEAVKTKAPPPTVKAIPAPAMVDVKSTPEIHENSKDDEDGSDNEASEAGNVSEVAEDDEEEHGAKQESDAEADEADEADEAEAEEADDEPTTKISAPSRQHSPPLKPIPTPTSILKKDSARPSSSSSAKGLSIKIPPTTPGGLKVHPLEALYKRNRQDDDTATAKTAPEAEPFSFFGNGDDDVEEDTSTATAHVPLTPFSRQDFETRGIRSAAPTPDTAHPSRMAKYWPDAVPKGIEEEEEGEDDNDEGKVEAEDTDMRDGDADDNTDEDGQEAGEGADPASDFQKWFWEHRGDLNRSWKKRRKTAAKEKRYRENRARADRAI